MNGWSWEAGASSGITDQRPRAQRHAEEALLSGDADTAVLQQVVIAAGNTVMGYGRYRPVAGTRAEGRRDGRRVRWDTAEAA